MHKFQIIALIDCDSFFVSCEQLDNPQLLNKPVCVLSNNDGCIISRSKEAKKMGIKMGMPYFMAKKEYPNAIYISGRYSRYVDLSNRVMGIIKTFSPNVEQYSIDEAFVDLTGLRKLYKRSYLEIAKMIKKEIKEKTGIPVSIGISTSKTLAKLASHRAKELNGTYIIGYYSIKKELKSTELNDVWGIGKNTYKLLSKYGIKTASDFTSHPNSWIEPKLGIRGLRIKEELLGKSVIKIETNKILPKSIQNSRSFPAISSNKEVIKQSIIKHINTSCQKLRELGLKTDSVSVMLKTKDFKYFCEKIQLKTPTSFDSDIIKNALMVFEKIYIPNVPYRSSGIILDNLISVEKIQISIFSNNQTEEKKEKLTKSIDKLTKKYKKNVIKIGFLE